MVVQSNKNSNGTKKQKKQKYNGNAMSIQANVRVYYETPFAFYL